jgi:L-fuconolactonase
MDDVGVDGAILVSSTRHDGTDNRYALESAARHPEHFRVVVRIDAADPGLPGQVAAAAGDERVVGVRLLATSDPERERFRAGGYDPAFAAAQAEGIPLCIYPPGMLGEVEDAARRFPDLQIVVDHLGLWQRPIAAPGSDPFADLPQLLALAACPNVAVKLSAVPTCCWQPFPFPEVWPHVHRVLEAFDADRVMWGSDCTRAAGIVSYAEGLRWLTDAGELSDGDLALLLGRTVRRIFDWEPTWRMSWSA